MGSSQSPSEQALIEAFNQNWLSYRHADKQRVWFTSAYATLSAGIFLVLISNILNRPNGVKTLPFNVPVKMLILLLLLFYTFAGLIITIKTILATFYFQAQAEQIVSELNLGGRANTFGAPYLQYGSIDTPIYMGIAPWFLTIYSLNGGVVIGWMLHIRLHSSGLAIVIGFIFFAISIIIEYKWINRRLGEIYGHIVARHAQDICKENMNDIIR